MSIELQTENDRLLIVQVSDKLTKDDYAVFLSAVDRMIKERHKISILFDMHNFHGWEAGAAWEDAKFGFRHFHDIERLAVIGEKKWQKAITMLGKPFTRAEVRYFPRQEGERAHHWLQEQPAAR